MTSAALVLIEEGTHAVLGGKDLVEESLPLAKTGQLLGLEPRERIAGIPPNQGEPPLGTGTIARQEAQDQDEDVKVAHLDFVPFAVEGVSEILQKWALAPQEDPSPRVPVIKGSTRKAMFQLHSGAIRPVLRFLSLAFLASQAAACNVFETTDEIADNARVVISGTAPAPLQLITSTKFERWYDEDDGVHTTLVQADTSYIDLTTIHDQIYPVKPDRGFFVRLVNRETKAAVVSLQVYFDGELTYDQSDVSLSDASIEFSYIFENQNQIQ